MSTGVFANRYSELKLLGRGGFGVVYRAWDNVIEGEVALKLLNAEVAADPDLRRRFEQEAKAARMLNGHPNITIVFDRGEFEGQPFIVMEMVDGEPLSRFIGEGLLSDPERLKLLDQLCDGLHYAHVRHIVHRDIKPSNLMVRSDHDGRAATRTLKILDFGIAKLAGSVMTTTGGQMFSRNYVSPELILGEQVGPRSDMFAVGAVAYELFSGRKAFEIKSSDSFRAIEEIKQKIALTPHTPLSALRPDLPPELTDAIDRSLAKAPGDRFRDLAEMREALHGVGAGLQHRESADATIAVRPQFQAALRISRQVIAEDPETPVRRLEEALRANPSTGERQPIEGRLSEARGQTADRSARRTEEEAERLPAERVTAERALRAVLPRLPADARGRWARLQTRLLDARAYADYVWLAVAGGVPLLVALAVGAYADSPLERGSRVFDACVAALGANPVITGYGSKLNWWPSFVYLPLALFIVRRAATRLFPAPGEGSVDDAGIVAKIPPRGRPSVAAHLKAAAHDPRNLVAVIALIAIINTLDLRETVAHYASAGSVTACPREPDWTVQFLAGRVSVTANAWLVALAYIPQAAFHGLGLMLVALLFRHNFFYLSRIYQRRRGQRHSLDEQLVLDFDDVERCFGMRPLHRTFNYQILVLIVGGLLMLASRLMNVDRTPIGLQYEAALSTLLPAGAVGVVVPAGSFGLADLFPDVGQVMLGIAWLVCFVVVAMPSFVKFLPLADKRVRLVGRLEYLLEFIPPTTSVPTSTPEEVDRLAMKFARSSFWPAGDERARTLYTIAYFVFFMMVVPVPPTSSAALAMHVVAVLLLSYAAMKLTFWLFRKTLMNIDASLART